MTTIVMDQQPSQLSFTVGNGEDVSESDLSSCAALFSANYGVWSSQVPPPLKAGARVKMTAKKLRSQCLSDPGNSLLARCHIDGEILVGHAFATVWKFDGGNICWITQLVVSSQYRERGIATSLLSLLPGNRFDCNTIGLVSSHPAACLALAKRAKTHILKVDLEFMKSHAHKILEMTPVEYLKNAPLRGFVFQIDGETDARSSAFTEYYVDHDEPLAALERWKEKQRAEWPLGDLLEGHEFLCIVRLGN